MRILGITIPDTKRLEIGLTTLFGVGRSRAQKILDEAKVDWATKAKDLTPDQENTIKKIIENFKIDSNTTLVGHSCGGGFLLRYLSEYPDLKPKRVILVAPWIDPDGFLKNGMFDFSIDENIVEKTSGITIFSSTNDMTEVQDSIKTLISKIKSIKVKEFKDMGHFCYEDMHTDVFPELLAEATS